MKIHLIAPTKVGETYLFNKGLLAPLSLMYLASYTPDDVEVRIIDENTERLDFSGKDIAGIPNRALGAAQPDPLGQH